MTASEYGNLAPRGTVRGQAALAALFWVFGLTLLFGPFLRQRASMYAGGDDPGRLASEIDIPFAEDVAGFEEEFELPLGEAIAETSAEWFGVDSEALHDSGLVELIRIEPGRIAYERYCVGCHAENGDGAGPAARFFDPRPRNFRRGIFKFTSTPNGVVPLRRDLFQTITEGLAGSSMPDFRLLGMERRWDLVEYVRYLAIRGSFEQLALDVAWDEEELPDLEELAEIVLERWSPERVKATYPPVGEPAMTAETIARGHELFIDLSGANCAACHGEHGKGDGPSATDFQDGWGYPVKPRDLTSGSFRVGSAPADLYRSIATGIGGTPMPAFDGAVSPEDIWALVHYTLSLKDIDAEESE